MSKRFSGSTAMTVLWVKVGAGKSSSVQPLFVVRLAVITILPSQLVVISTQIHALLHKRA